MSTITRQLRQGKLRITQMLIEGAVVYEVRNRPDQLYPVAIIKRVRTQFTKGGNQKFGYVINHPEGLSGKTYKHLWQAAVACTDLKEQAS